MQTPTSKSILACFLLSTGNLSKGHSSCHINQQKPVGWSSMCWLSWFSGPGCCWWPSSRASSRSLRLCHWTRIRFHGPFKQILGSAAVNNGTPNTSFCNTSFCTRWTRRTSTLTPPNFNSLCHLMRRRGFTSCHCTFLGSRSKARSGKYAWGVSKI